MIASLMMYERPELVDAHARYWDSIRVELRAVGIDSPELLSQHTPEMEVWNDPALVLSQTCGMPYRLWLHDQVALVGTPDFGLEGCAPGYYRSAIVVRRDDERTELTEFSEAVFAYNQTFSQSGYAAAYFHLESYGFWFARRLHTEQHIESARAVAEGRADLAAIDAVGWRLMQTYDSFAPELRVIEWTKPSPGLPYITAAEADVDAILEAVEKAIAALGDADRATLGIVGLVRIPKRDYLSANDPPEHQRS